MDPQTIPPSDWSAINNSLVYLFLFLFAMIGSAFAFLGAHALIPSMVDSGHLPRRLSRARPLLYLFSLATLAGAIFFLDRAVDLLRFRVLPELFPRWWI